MRANYKNRSMICFACGKLTTRNSTGKCPECQTPAQLEKTRLTPIHNKKNKRS